MTVKCELTTESEFYVCHRCHTGIFLQDIPVRGIGSQLCLSILKTGELRKAGGGMNEEKRGREETRR